MKPDISVIIPVYNESRIIDAAVQRILSHSFAGMLEVIVVDGDKSGSTVSAIGCNDVIKRVSSKGRGRQMNAGAAAAKGKILLFLHADTVLPEGAMDSILGRVTKNGLKCGAFTLGIDSTERKYRIIEFGANLRTRLTRIPYGDQGIFITKNLFDRMGGYSDIPLMEDVDLMKRVKKAGYIIELLPKKVKTSSRRWEKEGIFYCTVRNWTLILSYTLGASPGKLIKYYR